MAKEQIVVEQSLGLSGTVELSGAKNAVLVTMASLILTNGKSTLTNVPNLKDVFYMCELLKCLGADVFFDTKNNRLEVDTRCLSRYTVPADIMRKMRASVLVMGSLLSRFGKAEIALPGGCVIGMRPIDYHIKNFKKMGVQVEIVGEILTAHADTIVAQKLVLDYPSVGATENILMAAVCAQGTTRIVNAAVEPEVLDFISVLKKMGADITILPAAMIDVKGVSVLYPVEHEVMPDRLEAGSLLLAAAITGGDIYVPQAPAYALDLFLMKLQEMGHQLEIGKDDVGVRLKATKSPKAVSFKTFPYPGFPTDLQAPMMAAQTVAEGISIIEETVFENRLLHVRELQKMGAQIKVEHNTAIVTGVEELFGASVIATDIRASCGLVLAGLVAHGKTVMTGVHHWRRGYECLEKKLANVGASIICCPIEFDKPLVQKESRNRLSSEQL